MFLIYEERHRYLGNYSSEVILGYVNTEDEAKKMCDELNNTIGKERNEVSKVGSWRYYFQPINHINSIDNLKV